MLRLWFRWFWIVLWLWQWMLFFVQRAAPAPVFSSCFDRIVMSLCWWQSAHVGEWKRALGWRRMRRVYFVQIARVVVVGAMDVEVVVQVVLDCPVVVAMDVVFLFKELDEEDRRDLCVFLGAAFL
eukprot:127953_1